jgi:putative PIN family toxin of toxin-antitoxin system
MMTCYAVIDTNVLVSALLSSHTDSATVKVVEKIFTSEVIPVFSKEILSEYHEVLKRKKIHFDEKTVVAFLQAYENIGVMVIPEPSNEKLLDMKDLPFYEVVLSKQNDNAYLVTGNMKHFPKKPFIVTPNEFLEIIDQSK